MKYELLIERGRNLGIWQQPAVIEPVTWETHRKESPSVLTFTVIKDSRLGFEEGSRVKFKVNGKNVFLGYVFQKQRTKDHHIQVIAYDQLRYLKYKHSYFFKNLTATDFIKRMSSDFLLNTGTLDDSKYVIGEMAYVDQTLFDMVQTTIDETVVSTKNLYVLYDDFGKLTFKNIKDLKLDYVVNPDDTEDFAYTSSIDKDTASRVLIIKADEDSGVEKYHAEDYEKGLEDWGVLQRYEKWDDGENESQVKERAKALLQLYGSKTRSLTARGCCGDVRVRAGTSVLVKLSLGDLPTLCNYMLVEEAKHTFEQGHHTMDLTFKGRKEFYG